MLLSDDQFVAFAKDNLVVSWENVREPVNIQVDGERRTLGGNTVMYVVSPDGTVADAFPGVYRSEDVLPSLQAAVKVAMESHEARWKYHRQRTSKAIQARINASKAFVEGPVLDAIGAGDLFESSSVAGVIDLSHIARNREDTLKRLGIRSGLSEDEALRQAIVMDSRANMQSLRPKVHEFLLDEPKLPDEIRRTMFKDFLGVDIDDPNLGIR